MTHTDNTAEASNTYWYWAVSFNGAGDNNLCSDAASGTTSTPAISLTVNGYKVKGRKQVDLVWAGLTGPMVVIHREGATITTENSGAYTDITGQKGSSPLTYEVCEEGSTGNCTPLQTATF